MPWLTRLAVPWVVFAAVWLGSSFFTRRTVRRESLAARLSYGLPLALGCLFIFSRAGATLPVLDASLWRSTELLRWTGLAVCCAGIALTFWARATLGRLWSGTITLKEGHYLITSGPYGLARHPIYTGLSLGFLGDLVALGTLRAALGVALAIGSFVYKLGREERLMAAQFPDEHQRYRARVKRLIPFVW